MDRIEVKKKILIVDSDERQIDRVEKLIEVNAVLFNRKIRIHKAATICEADSMIRNKDIDILILGVAYREISLVEVPEIRLVKKLRSMDRYKMLPVIFVSAADIHKEYAYKELNCLSYLPRAFDEDEFGRVLQKAFLYTACTDDEKYIVLKKQTVMYLVRIKDIVYLEMKMRILHFHLIQDECLEIPYKTMKGVYEETEEGIWLVCNKSTMVNRAYIKGIRKYDGVPHLILMNENICIPIGRKYIEIVKEIEVLD